MKPISLALCALLIAACLTAGCQPTAEPAASAAPLSASPLPASPSPGTDWQEAQADNPLDDWFDDGAFEGAPQNARVEERAFDALPLLAEDGLSLRLMALRYVRNYAMQFAFTLENASGADVVLSASLVSVNGWMQEAVLLPLRAVSAGETVTCTLELSGLSLADFAHMAIEQVQSLSFTLTATQPDGTLLGQYDIAADALCEDGAVQQRADAGTELLADGAARVVFVGFDEEGLLMLFYAENRSEQTIRLELVPTYNNTLEGTLAAAEILPGASAMLRLLPYETLYANGMQELFFASVSLSVDGAKPVSFDLF